MLKWRIIWRKESYRLRYFQAIKEIHDLIVRGDLTYSGSYQTKNAQGTKCPIMLEVVGGLLQKGGTGRPFQFGCGH